MLQHTVASAGHGPSGLPALVPVTEQPAGSAGGAVDGSLRRRLLLLDAVELSVVGAVILGPVGSMGPVAAWRRLVVHVVLVLATLGVLAGQRLYEEAVTSVRAIEVRGIVRGVALGVLIAAVAGRNIGVQLSPARCVAAALASVALLGLGRSTYAGWLRASRVAGRFIRPVVLVGANDEAAGLEELMRVHPEFGYRLCGVIAPRDQVALRRAGATGANGVTGATGGEESGEPDGAGAGVEAAAPWLGELDDDAPRLVAGSGATSAIIAMTAVPYGELQRVASELVAAGIHVQVSTGLRGVDHRRLRWQPLAREPVFAFESARRPRWHAAAKRSVDVTVALFGLVVTLPVLAVAALAVKLEDGGPVFFGQERLGQDGRRFRVLKLRTMAPDAERRLVEVRDLNSRRGGPLFKLDRDPRVTRVGRLLRTSSVDELPQLVNVLRGQMSLVGPRPAPPGEAAGFDEELLSRRLAVRPGITGLWQVEARDNPEFGAYRRLDLFYVENWSLGFDLAILWTTIGRVLVRAARSRRGPSPTPSVALAEASAGMGES